METSQPVDWLSPSNLIAIYGAALSTVILIWKLIENINANRGRIKVRLYTMNVALTYTTHVGDFEEMLAFEITNKGKDERFISSEPGLEVRIPKQENKCLSLTSPNPLKPIAFPKQLVRGEKIDPFYNLKTVLASLQKSNANKIRGYVVDTLGKRYYSNWVKVQVLKDFITKD